MKWQIKKKKAANFGQHKRNILTKRDSMKIISINVHYFCRTPGVSIFKACPTQSDKRGPSSGSNDKTNVFRETKLSSSEIQRENRCDHTFIMTSRTPCFERINSNQFFDDPGGQTLSRGKKKMFHRDHGAREMIAHWRVRRVINYCDKKYSSYVSNVKDNNNVRLFIKSSFLITLQPGLLFLAMTKKKIFFFL